MLTRQGDRVVCTLFGMTLWIEPWGTDAVRVRATRNATMPPDSEVLLPALPAKVRLTLRDSGDAGIALSTGIADLEAAGQKPDATLINGNLTVTLAESTLRFIRNSDGKVLLEAEKLVECAGHGQGITGAFHSHGAGTYRIEARFAAYEDEKIFGMGQHRHGFLNQKGCVLDLFHHNCEINIPVALSSRGYGFIWNNPAVGRVEFGRNGTHWIAEQSLALDYVVVAGDQPSDILGRLADITGHAPEFPEWASGFWQCKLRYKTQEELLKIAREYKKRGLPIAVIVIDYFNWNCSGDYKFAEESWPDPSAMVAELKELGIETVVSNWPTVSQDSENYREMLQEGMLVTSEHGLPFMVSFQDSQRKKGWEPLALIDPTNPETRGYVWRKVEQGYVRHGIRSFWLDAIEPELITGYPDFTNIRYHVGNARQTCALFPWYAQKLYHDGLKNRGETDILTLGRSAFIGSQRFGAAVWNGDIKSSFEMLAASIRAGLNIGISGIPWWTTDIGGFHGGNIAQEYFQELIVRWFQYGVFCPLFRLHGLRIHPDYGFGDVPNEVWSFGERAYGHIVECLHLRERLRPYIREQMACASKTGVSIMRPLFVDFPDDGNAWEIPDQFMFGPDILVCPVTVQGATRRRVYLPAGTEWVEAASGMTLSGGQWLEVEAPLERIPVYTRKGAALPLND